MMWILLLLMLLHLGAAGTVLCLIARAPSREDLVEEPPIFAKEEIDPTPIERIPVKRESDGADDVAEINQHWEVHRTDQGTRRYELPHVVRLQSTKAVLTWTSDRSALQDLFGRRYRPAD